jgi:hypothetical protein
LTETEGLLLIKAALIMLNKYADVLASADLLEDAIEGLGKNKVEDLMWDLSRMDKDTTPELKRIKAELMLSHLSPMLTLEGVRS